MIFNVRTHTHGVEVCVSAMLTPFCCANCTHYAGIAAALETHGSDTEALQMCTWALLMLLADDPAQLRAYKHLHIEDGLRAIIAEDSGFLDAAKDLARAALAQL